MSETGYGNVHYLHSRPGATAERLLGPPDGRGQVGATLLTARWVRRSRFSDSGPAPGSRPYDPHQNTLQDYILGNHGTLIPTPDNSMFAYFERPADAVQAAIHAQRALESLNHDGTEQMPAVKAQIGIHTGRIAWRSSGPQGEEVGVAASLAALAVPEGICVSKPVYDATRNDWHIATRHLGLFQGDDLARDIRVYLLKPTGITWRDICHYWLRSACPRRLPRSAPKGAGSSCHAHSQNSAPFE